MMRAGVPLLQAFDIVAKGTANSSVARLFTDIKGDVETGTALSQAFRKYPLYFDSLFCNLVGAGEQAGILDDLLDRLATYKEKMQAIKGKIKSALFYPMSVIIVAALVLTVIMLFVIPAFKQVFEGFGANLPAPTMMVIAMSDFFIAYWYLIFGVLFGAGYFFMQAWRRSPKVQMAMDRLMLRLPIFGEVIRKASGETIDLKAYEADMRHLLDTYIQADEPRKISPFDDMTLLELIVQSGICLLYTSPSPRD